MKLAQLIETRDPVVLWKERIDRLKADIKAEGNPDMIPSMKQELERKQKHLKQLISKTLKENGILNVRTPSVEQIAKKHGVSVAEIEKQLNRGIKIEKEHTTHTKIAREIACDHLNEDPKYYVKLKKVEEK